VTLTDGRKLLAAVCGVDELTDLAVLKIEGKYISTDNYNALYKCTTIMWTWKVCSVMGAQRGSDKCTHVRTRCQQAIARVAPLVAAHRQYWSVLWSPLTASRRLGHAEAAALPIDSLYCHTSIKPQFTSRTFFC
jgi:hypothetical protein